jgi:hypothetical protein
MALQFKQALKFNLKSAATVLLFSQSFFAAAQSVGVSNTAITPHTSSIMELRATNKGFLPPRMATAQRDLISSPAVGLMIYNTTTSQLNFYTSSGWRATDDVYAAANANTSGVGIFLNDSAYTLRFKGVGAASGKIAVASNTANNTIDLDVNESNLSLNNIGGSLNVAKGGTGQTSYANGELLIGNSAGSLSKSTLSAGNGINISNGSGSVTISSNIPVTEAYSLTNVTTSSTSYVSAGLSVTPGAGDYIVYFTGNVENPTKDESTYFSLFANGSQILQSERFVTGHVKGGENFSASTMAYVTNLEAGQSIEVKWKVTASNATMHQRQLIVQRVK